MQVEYLGLLVTATNHTASYSGERLMRGKTAIHYSAKQGHKEVVQLLIMIDKTSTTCLLLRKDNISISCIVGGRFGLVYVLIL